MEDSRTMTVKLQIDQLNYKQKHFSCKNRHKVRKSELKKGSS